MLIRRFNARLSSSSGAVINVDLATTDKATIEARVHAVNYFDIIFYYYYWLLVSPLACATITEPHFVIFAACLIADVR